MSNIITDKLHLLDCTLRDGGYVNDWNFGHHSITSIYKQLDSAGVDYIEVGFLDDRRPFDPNRSIAPNTECFYEIFKDVKKKHALPVAMINFGTCDLSNIGDCSTTFIEGIRVIFKKEKIDKALPFCKAIKEKGYKLFIQAISITAYSDMEMLKYVEKINGIKPYAFSIVDTYGLLDTKWLTHYFNLIDNNLDPEIIVGYHAHNNFQLAFSNSMNFLHINTKRDRVVDATVYGMGKSAGNCPIELLSMQMNKYFDKKYDINSFLEIMDVNLMPIYQKRFWGYKYNFYISAMQNCHPNYVQYLLDKKTLTVTSINEILSALPEEKKLLYDEICIEKLYSEHQTNNIDDSEACARLTEALGDKEVLLLGPGGSIVENEKRIKNIIKEKGAVTISVNFATELFESEYVFLSNAKRYNAWADMFNMLPQSCKMILTSNINAFDRKPDYVINYSSLLRGENYKKDNALLLVMKLMQRIGKRKIFLAGFDGFTGDNSDYYDVSYSFASEEGVLVHNNEIISDMIMDMTNEIDVEFITPSLYKMV
ncbi:aldolase catalytic domain-containing protein [Selenomonas ruminantium]|uniref:4-hydroxy 2-oxovalerate aldolase n=1 Tax=Selenomonas ruminantium TaxID=971 RepID=A0A1H0S0S2_SELRU|nr:aldolase catalytic domain-containing protein [Selenomonas ruminantium]SDP35304.1 4-hydroxy 2-oxovalerate aldolase [Selenomonas ruminantium]